MLPSEERNPVEELAEEFVERFRRGERPALTEYTSRHPELAQQIRDLFPALLLMEDIRPGVRDATGASAAARSNGPGLRLERIGDFRILREVGRGGMGIVFEAEQESLGRHVALKVLPVQTLLDPKQLQRFQREAKAAAKLHHTNIVPVYGVGEDNGLHYYVMQFIQGQGLDQVLEELIRLRQFKGQLPGVRGGPTAAVSAADVAQALLTGTYQANQRPNFPDPALTQDASSFSLSSSDTAIQLPGQPSPATLSDTGRAYWQSVARIGIQVAEALAYAHGQGTLHRDIKPSNLLLDTQGIVWVTDFGLAKATADTENLTHTGDIVGTLRYMAPERFQGQSDARSDIYALGLTLYEMLTLRPAFGDGDRNRLLQQLLHEEPPRPRKLNRAVPHDLETIVLKATDRDPARRYATAADMAADLKRFIEDRPIRARRSSYGERLWRWCRRNPAVASLLVLLLVVFLTGFAAVTVKWREAEDARGQAETAKGQAETAERIARLREAEALVGQAHGTRLSQRPGQRFAALDALRQAAAIGRELEQPREWFDNLRNEAIAALALPDVHITHEFGEIPPGTNNVALNDDFTWYARTTTKGSCTILRVADDQEVTRLPEELGEPALAEFGSGQHLAVIGQTSRRFQLWDLSGPRPAKRFTEQGVHFWHFRPDGRLLVLSHRDGSISVYDPASAICRYRLAPVEIIRDLGVRLHPTHLLVVVWSYFHSLVQLRDLRTGAVVASARSPWVFTGGCVWSPDGRTLLVAEGHGPRIQEHAFEPEPPALRPTRIFPGLATQGGPDLLFHPGGDRFLSRGWSGTVNLYNAVSGHGLFATHALTALSTLLRFDRTGQKLAGARVGAREERIGLWSIADGREYHVLVHDGTAECSQNAVPAIHPGGRLAALGLTDGVALFDLESGRELAHVRLPEVNGTVAFDGEGNLLTNGFGGFFRWPLRWNAGQPNQLRLGPPIRLPFHKGDCRIAVSNDGQVIAQCMYGGYGMQDFAGGWILHPNSPYPRRVAANCSMIWCSVSKDGRWVAFGQHDAHHVYVFEAATGKRVWQAPDDPHNCCRFTPNGRWLATDLDGGQLYRVGTWEPGPQLGPGRLWDVTDELAVLGFTNGIYRLVELSTGRELARLEDPEQNNLYASFTPDGTKLVVRAKNGLRVWDLRRLRAELGKLGLDWNAKAYPPAPTKDSPPLQLTVDPSSLDFDTPQQTVAKYTVSLALLPLNPQAYLCRGRAYYELRQYRQAADDLGVAVALNPKNDDPYVWLEWGYAASNCGRSQEAVTALSRTIELRPRWAEAWHQRAHVYERLRQVNQALADFSTSIELQPHEPTYWICRANAYVKQEHWDRALADYSQSIAEQTTDPFAWYARALLLLHQGDRAGYRQSCAAMHKHFAASTDPEAVFWATWTCALGADAVADWTQPLQWAEKGLAAQPADCVKLTALGAVLYRAGRLEQAAKRLVEAEAAFKNAKAPRTSIVYTQLFLAMTYKRLGHDDEAKQCLARAVRTMEDSLKENQDDPAARTWNRRLTFQLLRQEAQALVNEQK